jgi:hypothetical protein
MRISGRVAILLSLSLPFTACVQPVHKVFRDESFMKRDAGREGWRKVAVLPFAGDPVFRRTAAEWFAFRVRKQGLFKIVDPSIAEIELGEKGMLFGEAPIPVDEARKAGRLLGADGVVFGSVDPRPPPGRPGSANVTASIVDTATGKVVATSVRSYPAWAPHSRHMVMPAVTRVEEDLIPVFFAAAGKVWTPPRKDEGDGSGPRAREDTGTGR